MFKKILVIFMVVMLTLPTAAFAAGKSDVAAGKSQGKGLERQDSQAATGDAETETGDVAVKNKDARGSETALEKAGNGIEGDVSAIETREKSKPGKSIVPEGVLDENGEESNSGLSRKAEKEAEKEARKAEIAARKAEKEALKAERMLGRDDTETAEESRTANGIQTAAAAIQANIDRLVEKFGDGVKNAQSSLQHVLDKFNGWVEAMLSGGEKNTGSEPDSDEGTSEPGSDEETSTPGSDDDTGTPDIDDNLDSDDETETSGTAES